MNKLSQREVRLLFLLAFLLVFVLGFMYWLEPLKSKNNILTQEKEHLEVEAIEMKTKIASTKRLSENKESLLEDVEVLMGKLSDPVAGDVFDRTINSLATDYGVVIKSVNYGGVDVVAPSIRESEVDEYEYNLKKLVDTYLGYTVDDFEKYESEHEVLRQSITLDLEGSYVGVQKFMRDLNNLGQTYFIESFNYNQKENQIEVESLEEDVKYKIDLVETATIVLDVYFIDTNHAVHKNLNK